MFNCGSNWNNAAYGLASFNGNNDRTNRNENIGFRSALPNVRYRRLKGLPSVQGNV